MRFSSFMFWHKTLALFKVLYLFRDISSFKSEKGDNIKLSRTGFLHKQKR